MCTVLFAFTFSMLLSCTFSDWYDLALLGAEVKHTLKAAAAGVVHNRTLIVRCVGEVSLTIRVSSRNYELVITGNYGS